MITYIISLIYFSKHSTLQVHRTLQVQPSMLLQSNSSFFFMAEWYPIACMCVCVNVYMHLLYPFTYWWTFSLFPYLATTNNAALNIIVHTYFQISVFVFFRYIPRSGLGGSYGSFIFNYLRTYHTVFYRLHQFTFPPTRHKGLLSSTPSPTSEMLSAWCPS